MRWYDVNEGDYIKYRYIDKEDGEACEYIASIDHIFDGTLHILDVCALGKGIYHARSTFTIDNVKSDIWENKYDKIHLLEINTLEYFENKYPEYFI